MTELVQYIPEVQMAILPFVAAAGLVLGLNSAAKGRAMASRHQAANLAYQKERDAELDKQRDIYRSIEFNNPYANLENKFEGNTNKVLPIVVHGDAAIAGQGLPYEIVQMAKLKG